MVILCDYGFEDIVKDIDGYIYIEFMLFGKCYYLWLIDEYALGLLYEGVWYGIEYRTVL